MPYAWQVRRSELDEILFRNASRKGARTVEGVRARKVAFDDDGADVEVELEGVGEGGARRTETWRARFVVDASGRDTLLANQLGCKKKNARHNSSALYAHFTGVERLPGKLEGNITIFWFAHGWFWLIPLADGTTSIGAVCWPYYLKSRNDGPCPISSPTRSRCAPRWRAPRRRDARLARSMRPATTPTAARAERRALPDAGRRLRVHRSGVLVGRVTSR